MKTKISISPATKRELRILGAQLRAARLRRELPQSLIAERASISRPTITRIENGDPSVSIGSYAMVMQALGLIDGWGTVEDKLGEVLAEEQLRKRAPRDGT
ncbi:helix-turn-helix domain-containing protein [Pararhizobium sp. LjRoot235]|uniref:helix-turn-helix domain-containing protein n=1 Tax=Pararhizobium sp. LjRoot235 TaxID=3342291 RepID=UPI003ECED138